MCPTKLQLPHLPSVKTNRAAETRTMAPLPARHKDRRFHLLTTVGVLIRLSALCSAGRNLQPVRRLWRHRAAWPSGQTTAADHRAPGPWPRASTADGLRHTTFLLGSLVSARKCCRSSQDNGVPSWQELCTRRCPHAGQGTRSTPAGLRGGESRRTCPGKTFRGASSSIQRVCKGWGLKESSGKKLHDPGLSSVPRNVGQPTGA